MLSELIIFILLCCTIAWLFFLIHLGVQIYFFLDQLDSQKDYDAHYGEKLQKYDYSLTIL